MADRAAAIANNAKDLKEFDKQFATEYMGRPLDGISAAISLAPKSLGGTGPILNANGGQSDFKPQFQEGDDPNNDQTHHFTAYFSGGINGMAITTTIHQSLDDNKADKNLANAAYNIGRSLVKGLDDSREIGDNNAAGRLKNIGETIKKEICDIKK